MMKSGGKMDEVPDGVKMGEILKASAEVNTFIAYLAMKDFTDGLTTDLVKQLSGITELADYVRKISGASEDAKAEVEEFRE
jgi:TolB-like protein